MEEREPFVADGARRFRASETYGEEKARIVATVRERFRAELRSASGVRRLLILYKRHRAVQKELARLAPVDACYARPDARGEEP